MPGRSRQGTLRRRAVETSQRWLPHCWAPSHRNGSKTLQCWSSLRINQRVVTIGACAGCWPNEAQTASFERRSLHFGRGAAPLIHAPQQHQRRNDVLADARRRFRLAELAPRVDAERRNDATGDASVATSWRCCSARCSRTASASLRHAASQSRNASRCALKSMYRAAASSDASRRRCCVSAASSAAAAQTSGAPPADAGAPNSASASAARRRTRAAWRVLIPAVWAAKVASR